MTEEDYILLSKYAGNVTSWKDPEKILLELIENYLISTKLSSLLPKISLYYTIPPFNPSSFLFCPFQGYIYILYLAL